MLIKLIDRYFALALALVAFFVLLPFARLDFDQHHDGYMAAGAIVSRDSGVIFKDVFAQYGSATPWIQGLWLRVFDEPVLGIRILNVIFIALSILVLAKFGTRMPKGWPVTPATARLSAVCWFVLNDVFTSVPMHPWSSVIATFLTIFGIYSIGKAIYFFENNQIKYVIIYSLLSGISISTTIFTRLSVGILNLIFGIALVLILYFFRKISKNLPLIWISSSLVTLLVVFIFYFLHDTLNLWLVQTVEWPQQTYSNKISAIISMNLYLLNYYRTSIFILLLLAVIELLRSIERIEISSNIILGIRTLVGFYLVWFIFLSDAKVQISPDTFNSTPLGLKLNLFLEMFTYICFVFSVFNIFSSIIYFIFKKISLNNLIYRVALSGFALAAFSQMIHSPDTRHLWWGLPLGLLLYFLNFEAVENRALKLSNPFYMPILVSIFLLPNVALSFMHLPRTLVPPGFVASGMWVEQGIWNLHVSNYEFLKNNLSEDERVVFLVRNGDLSVFDGNYHADSANFVWWGPPETSLESRLEKVNKVVVDTDNLEMMSLVKKSGFKEIGSNTFISLFVRDITLTN